MSNLEPFPEYMVLHREGRKSICLSRTYVKLDTPQFSTVVPPDISTRIAPEVLERTVKTINRLLVQADAVTVETVLHNIISLFTLFIVDIFWKQRFERVVRTISAFVKEENQRYYEPAGLRLVDPLRTGLLHLEIEIY
ncbi:Golgin subfamily A member 7/ERF4 [Phlyctochytrium arcticum]|nr:Golgin subfamily A member 7/ERF4 [Phlyctochytrium arcticum]